MLITVFLDYPDKIMCIDKHSISDLLSELVYNTTLSEEEVIDLFSQSLAAILLLSRQEKKEGWDILFADLEPKRISDKGELESINSELDKDTQIRLMTGAHNFACEMKTDYPDIYERISDSIEAASKLKEFSSGIEKAKNDPELAILLNSAFGEPN